MSFWNRLFGKQEQPAQPAKRAITWDMAYRSGLIDSPTRSGVHVNEQTALGVSAVWCAVNVISQSIGSLPLPLYRKTGTAQAVATDHPLAAVLDIAPNYECTARVFWETFMSHCLLWGNGFAEIERDNAGNPLGLWIIHPKNIQADRDASGRLVYKVRVNGLDADLAAEDVLHVPGLSPDTVYGHQLLSIARDNIGFTIQADRYGQHYFANAGNVGTYLTYPGQLSDPARENIRRSFQSSAGGVENTGKVYLLEEGMTANRQTLSNEAGQYNETRQFQITEVSRLFNVTPVKLHELGRATWGNLGTLNTDFWGSTCRPWATKIEAEISRKLLAPEERGTYFAEFDADTLLRGDLTTRYAAYAQGIQAGFLTPELVATWENIPLPPKPAPATPENDGNTQQSSQLSA